MTKPTIISLFGLLVTCQRNVVVGHSISGELYSSLTHMNDLFVFDSFVGSLLPYIPTYLPEVNRYKESHEALMKDVSRMGKGDLLNVAITGNPLHSFSVIKRLVLYWPQLRLAVYTVTDPHFSCTDDLEDCKFWASWSECELNPSFMRQRCRLSCGLCSGPELRERLKDLGDLESRTVLPIENDLRGASLALARLQQIYRIPISQMAQGIIEGVAASVRINVYDCIRIANESHYDGEYANAYQWYHYAAGLSHDPDLRSLVRTQLRHVAVEHDANFQNSNPKFFPYLSGPGGLQVPWDELYNQLCRGLNLMDPATVAKLKCHVSSQGSPFLILRPVKYEQLHLDPELYMFYDVIGDNEIQAIQETAKDQLHRSMTVGSEKPVEIRVSQTSWLSNDTHPLFPGIARRISAVTGLYVHEGTNYFAGEPLQVLSYGIGGHYKYHFDPLWKQNQEEKWESQRPNYINEFDSGDRIATWMFYLSDVKAGGRTAFPKAGVSAKPIKGGAVFWYNLKRNGQLNPMSEHGGCPVLLGHKWATNKWIRESINFMKRPCSLDPHE